MVVALLGLLGVLSFVSYKLLHRQPPEDLDLVRRRREDLHRQEEENRRRMTEERRRKCALDDKETFFRVLSEASDIVDACIRTRNKFNSSDPLAYKVSFNQLENGCGGEIGKLLSLRDVPNIDDYYKRFIPLNVGTVVTFYAEQHRVDHRFRLDGEDVKVSRLTPFQGDSSHRVFGSYKCFNCGKRWESAGSWRDRWQQCKQCDTEAYPYKQKALDRRNDDDDQYQENKRPHDMDRCEECRKRGRLCVPSMYYAA
jgi:hypothetical protein